jgi:P4 family phage/plasmid primase-like protien
VKQPINPQSFHEYAEKQLKRDLAVYPVSSEEREKLFPEWDKLREAHDLWKTSKPKTQNTQELPQSKEGDPTILALLLKDRREATEAIVQRVIQKNHLYTTRNSKNPETWIYQEGIYVPHGETYIQETVRNTLGQAYTTQLANEIINKIRADTYIEPQEFFDKQNEHINILPVQNGLLNLYTKELSEFTPKKFFFHKAPVYFNPKAKCPKIQEFVKEVLDNEQDVAVMQEFFGFALLKEYRYEKSLMLHGSGSNGKSKLIELLKLLVGAENCSSMSLHALDQQFGLGQLHNKLLNVCGDISSHALKGTGMFKSLTGRDPVTADRKYLEPIQFVNYAKMVFSANQIPPTNDLTEGFFRRWIIFKFPYKFVGEDVLRTATTEEKQFLKLKNPKIIEEITTEKELSGLLNWALEGLQRLEEQNEFSYSKNTEEIKEAYIRQSDSFAAFCMDRITQDWNSHIPKLELKKEYSIYCTKHNLQPTSDRGIKAYLSKEYAVAEERKTIETERQNCWIGISFINDVRDVKDVTRFQPYSKSSSFPIRSNTLDSLDTLDTNSSLVEVEFLKDQVAFMVSEKQKFDGAKWGDTMRLPEQVVSVLERKGVVKRVGGGVRGR